MFGNVTGWIISAVIAVVAALVTYALVQAGVPTAPTGFAAEVLKPLTLVSAAEPFLKTTNTDDAGILYRDAIKDFNNHPDAYESLQHTMDYAKAKAIADNLPGLVNLLRAADARCIGIFAGTPERIINSQDRPDDLEAIDGIGKTAGMVAALAKVEKDYPTARQYGRAILVLGVHLYQERLDYLEFAKGETLISLGISVLGSVDEAMGSSPDMPIDAAFKAQYSDESTKVVQPIVAKMNTLSPVANAENAGDMFVIATGNNYDRMWRVAAIRRIGRLQRNSDSKADQVKAARVLKELSVDPKEDPIIHLAASNALNMTESDFQSQR
jgi:hypothetical protein